MNRINPWLRGGSFAFGSSAGAFCLNIAGMAYKDEAEKAMRRNLNLATEYVIAGKQTREGHKNERSAD